MLPPERRSLTILHKISWSQCCLPAALALAVVLATVPSIEEASAAMGFGRQGSHSFGRHARGTFNTPRTINTQKSFHQTPINRSPRQVSLASASLPMEAEERATAAKPLMAAGGPAATNAIRA